MPPTTPSKQYDLDNYGFDFDDPFGESPTSKKRKAPDAIGIDEEVAVTKRVRAPAVKLNEQRLLSDAGIPRLRADAHRLKIKGKGHEFADAQRLLAFYQLWLDELFPKARFLDALAMVEKLGHKRVVRDARNAWINEDKPGEGGDEDAFEDEFGFDHGGEAEGRQQEGAEVDGFDPFAPLSSSRSQTPLDTGIPDDADIYGPTVSAPSHPRPQPPLDAGFPDDEDIYGPTLSAPPRPLQPPLNSGISDDEDIYGPTLHAPPRPATSVVQDLAPGPDAGSRGENTTSRGHAASRGKSANNPSPTLPLKPRPMPTDQDMGDDDLQAMIAEAEQEDSGQRAHHHDFADDEEAMLHLE